MCSASVQRSSHTCGVFSSTLFFDFPLRLNVFAAPLLFPLPGQIKNRRIRLDGRLGVVAEPEQAQITRRCGPDPASCSSY